jgi:hypothetical protein
MRRFATTIAFACFAMPVAAGEAGSKETDQSVLGVWQLQYTAPDGAQHTPIVIVGRQYDNYLAWYLADKEPQAFRDVELKGDKLVGKITPPEHPDVTVTCEASLKGDDQCDGTANYRTNGGDTGSWKFTGQRMKLSSFDEVMTWKLEVTVPDGKLHAATVTVVTKSGNHYAWISSEDLELPARSISIQGDKVELKVAAEGPDGTKAEVTFRGAVAGDEVTGTAEFTVGSRTGTLPFKATRAS